MAHTQVYRSGTTRALGAVTVLICLGGLVTLALRHEGQLLRFGPALVLAAWLVWLAYWRPKVVVDDEAVTLHNVFRTVRVPWSSVVELHSRYGLKVETQFGSYNAWAVPAPFGRERLRGTETEATLMARHRMERLQGLGLVGHAPEEPQVQVQVPAVAVAVVLAAAALLAVLVL